MPQEEVFTRKMVSIFIMSMMWLISLKPGYSPAQQMTIWVILLMKIITNVLMELVILGRSLWTTPGYLTPQQVYPVMATQIAAALV